jgi:hypothetical protein
MALDRRVAAHFVATLVFLLLISCGADAADDVRCGTEAQIARARAQRLKSAADYCRRDLAAGHPGCVVSLESWNRREKLSIAQADALASKLQSFANNIEGFDNELEKRRQNFEVHIRGTVVSKGMLKCVGIDARPDFPSAALHGDTVMACKIACYNEHYPEYMDCWRGGIDEMGACFINTVARLKICSASCGR